MIKQKHIPKIAQYLMEPTINYISKNPVRNARHVLWAFKSLGMFSKLKEPMNQKHKMLLNREMPGLSS